MPTRTVTVFWPGQDPESLTVFTMESEGLTTTTDASDGGLVTEVPVTVTVPVAVAGVSLLFVSTVLAEPLPLWPGARVPMEIVVPLVSVTVIPETVVSPVFVTV